MAPLASGRPSDPFVDLADDLVARVKGEFLPGERCLWAGRPVRPDADRMSGWIWATWLLAFAVLGVLGSVTLKEAIPGGLQEKAGTGLLVGGVIGGSILVISLGISINEGRTERARRRQTIYAVSDRRAIAWMPAAGQRAVEVVMIPARSIGAVHRVEYDDGSGDVVFSGNVPHPMFRGFLGVAEVRRVEALAREILVDPDFRGFADPTPDEDL